MSGPGKPGRSPMFDSPMTTAKVSIPEEMKDYLREIGDGNLSKGARTVIKYHQQHHDSNEDN